MKCWPTQSVLTCLIFASLTMLRAADVTKAAKPQPRTRAISEPGMPKFVVVGTASGESALVHATPGMNPPVEGEGDFVIGPEYIPARELTVEAEVPKGKVIPFTLESAASKWYPGITKVPPGQPENYLPPDLSHVAVFPKPYSRTVTVYVPAGVTPDAVLPFIVLQDGPDKNLPTLLDNLIAQHRVPAMVAVMIQNGGGDAMGSERGLEYDTMSGRYAEFVETEVLPRVEKIAAVTLTKDPEGRATMGTSSGGAAAFSMAWYHPELYHRVLTFSGTYVNQASPFNPAAPHGAWEYHEHLISENPAKPIRVWLEVGDRDLLNPNTLRDGMHDWVEANNRMAAALKAKGYHYQYVFALNAGHGDRAVRNQVLPQALEWLWHGYVPERAR